MSLYAYLICSTGRSLWWLGKVVRRPDGSVLRFSRGARGGSDDQAQRVQSKFLADHPGHDIRVIVPEAESDEDLLAAYGDLDEYVEIGGDTDRDIAVSDYLGNWPEP